MHPHSRVELAPAAWIQREYLRVLVVDDFVPMANHLHGLLQGDGYDVRVAYDGAQALRVAEEFGPDALVSDIQMPGLNGFELAEAVAERFPKCRIVLITIDSELLRMQHKGRVHKISHKSAAPDVLLRFLAGGERDD